MAITSINNSTYNPKRVIVTDNGEKYEKAGKLKTGAAMFAANMAGGVTAASISSASAIPIRNMVKEMTSFMLPSGNNELSSVAKEFIDGASKAFSNSGLAKKGVEFVNVKNMSDLAGLEKSVPNWIKKIPVLNKFSEIQMKGMKSSIVNGNNACFAPKINKIFVNSEKMAYASFHEMGHALNKHTKGIGKILAKTRQPAAILSAVALLTAICKRKKVDGEKPKGIIDKTTTFIKDNCGKLAFLGMLPTVLEEGLASYKGAKLAKEVLSEKNYKLMNKFHGKAWLTYAALAVGTTAATIIASKVRDSLTKPKKIEQ